MTPRRPLVVTALTVCTLVACDSFTGPPERLEQLPRQLTIAEQEVIASSNAFAFDLLREEVARSEPGSNVFISPFSVSMALGMTLNGAAGETFDSMRTTLRFEGLTQTQVNESYRDLLALLVELDGGTTWDVANSVWARQGFPFVPAFFDTVQDYFGAEAREMDFGDPATRDVINQWVSDATNGRIDTIVESISPLDILFLINAVYFKGDWTTKFDRDRTAPAPFQSATGSGSIQVETMNARDMLAGLFHLGATGIEGGELPYGNQAFTLTVVMPPHGGSVEDVVAALDDQAWKSWMEQISYDSVHVALPKMEIEYETRLDSVLMTLGMGVAFDANRSDFSNLTPAQDAHISRVRHKTFLKVDEEGTEAAAATSVDIGLTSLPQGLYVDRPFILAIRERLSGTILFLGVIRDPRG